MTSTVAIHVRSNQKLHSGRWAHRWIELCQERDIQYQVIDVFTPDGFRAALESDICLMHFGNYVWHDMLHARAILTALESAGVRVFPGRADQWHFDDKVAQSYLFEAIGAPIPRWWAFYSLDEFKEWVKNNNQWPVVAKLRSGSGSHNVRLLNERTEAEKYGRRMFSRGFGASPSLAFKASSNVKSSRSIRTALARARRIPEFLRTRREAKQFPAERGYVYMQEFVPNAGFDIKAVVVNGKFSYFARRARSNDFRASGGADFFYDDDLIRESLVDSLLAVSRRLGSLCLGFDIVVNAETGLPMIIEVSYGFNWRAVAEAKVWWDEHGHRHEGPLNTPDEILDALLSDPRGGAQ